MTEMAEVDFRMCIKMIFTELKQHILTQCKEAKNHVKTLQELTVKIASIERNIINLIELKNTTQEFHSSITSINRIDQVKEIISELEDCLSEIRQADKNREKRIKRSQQNL
ncbi:LINE-1 retrotransposable element ORF1 protein [Plecturocebus cupreus]